MGEALGCCPAGLRGAGWQGNGSGWGGGRGGEEGPDNKGDIQGLRWSRARKENGKLQSVERPAQLGAVEPYKEMLFSLSQWGWAEALCPRDRAALVGGAEVPPAPGLCERRDGALNGPLLHAQHSLSGPAGPRPPTPEHPSPSVPRADWRGKEKNKTKQRLGQISDLDDV